MYTEEDKGDMVLVTENDLTPNSSNKTRVSIIKVSGCKCSDAFKGRLGFSFTVISV